MRIAWCTPLAEGSSIGHNFSLPVVAALRRQAVVDLWHPHGSPPPQGVISSALPRDSAISDALADYDAIVYNVGNHSGHHGDIVQAARSTPGVVVLHDLVLHNLYYGLAQTDFAAYLMEVRTWYGDAAAARAEEAHATGTAGLWTLDRAPRYPMFEPAVRGAEAVIVHSMWAKEHVARRFLGPIEVLGLAHGARHGSTKPRMRAADEPVILITVGHVNVNKRVERVVEALGELPARANVVYMVCGPYDADYGDRLRIHASSLGVNLRLLGPVSDQALDDALSAADISINLREPVLETGSGSLAEAMLHGLPVVATNAGAYAETPDTCVTKVRPGCSPTELAAAMSPLIHSSELRTAAGAASRAHAASRHDATAYAAGILEVLRQRGRERPLRALAVRMARTLTALGLSVEGPPGQRVASVGAELFAPRT